MEGVYKLKELPPGVGGEKAQRLAWLHRQGFSVPPGFVISAAVDDPTPAIGALASEETLYAVRSSGDGEDGPATSFAGQLDSVVSVPGGSPIVEAVARVRGSASGDRARAYGDTSLSVHVIVQEFVIAVASGVVFTRNPLTGLDERIVEAVSGPSDAILSGGAEPHRWVWRWGAFREEPGDSTVPSRLIRETLAGAEQIAARWGHPVDLEWVYDGTRLWWVQLRPIGNLDVTVYSNRISREVLPGAIKPLVWSVNVPLVNSAWIRLFERAVGPTGLEPEDLASSFGYHAYFNMSAMGELFARMGMPRDSLELLLGLPEGPASPSMRPSIETMRLVPRLLGFAWRTGRAQNRARAVLSAWGTLIEAYRALDLAELSDGDLWAAIDRLDADLADLAETNIVIPLLLNIWNRLLRRSLASLGDSLEFDLDRGLEEQLRAYDPQSAMQTLAHHVARSGPDHSDSRRALATLLQRYGHLSDSGNDFSTPTWAEQPELVVELAKQHEAPAPQTRIGWDQILGRVPRWRRPYVRRIGARARTYRVLREAVGARYTEAYGLYRPLFLEVGRRLQAVGWLEKQEDVFYADRAQLRMPDQSLLAVVAQHRAAMTSVGELDLPETIYGDGFVPRPRRATTDRCLTGTATSRGTYTGPVRVIRSADQVDRLCDGDVLVVPFSDVGWTPLFGRAGAVVAESGGLLSHSSIIAREYGIPCVVSVNDACALADGTTVTVDGDRGEVRVEAG